MQQCRILQASHEFVRVISYSNRNQFVACGARPREQLECFKLVQLSWTNNELELAAYEDHVSDGIKKEGSVLSVVLIYHLELSFTML